MKCVLAQVVGLDCHLMEMRLLHQVGVILLTIVCGITLLRKITVQQLSFILMEF